MQLAPNLALFNVRNVALVVGVTIGVLFFANLFAPQLQLNGSET